MNDRKDRAVVIASLRAAIPYMRLFQGRTFVVKASGAAFTNAASARGLVEQLGVLHQVGIRTVLVHGGGGQTTTLAERLGVATEFVAGRRVTSEAALEVAKMSLNGSVQASVLAAGRGLGIPTVGVSGIDAGLIKARRRPPRRQEDGQTVDYGQVGDIVSVDSALLNDLLDRGYVPVVSPLCADEEGQVLNVNADVVAARLARELEAEKLLVVTRTAGILEDAGDPGSLVSYTDVRGLNRLLDEERVSEGMLPKIAAIKDALYGGVPRVHVVSGELPDALLLEVFTNEGSGTLVVLDQTELTPAEKSGAERLQNLLAGGSAAAEAGDADGASA